MSGDTPTPAVLDKGKKAPEDAPDQTWIAHVENGTVKSRVKSEDWPKYAKENNL